MLARLYAGAIPESLNLRAEESKCRGLPPESLLRDLLRYPIGVIFAEPKMPFS